MVGGGCAGAKTLSGTVGLDSVDGGIGHCSDLLRGQPPGSVASGSGVTLHG